MGIRRFLRASVWALAIVIPDGASAQLSCLHQSQGALLAQFSDNAPPNTIAPQNVRNIICSTLLGQGQGASVTPLGGPTTSSPFTYTFTSSGNVVINSGTVSLSRDNGVTFYQASVMGGEFGVLTGDQVKVVWYGAGVFQIPTITFFPSSSP